MMRFASVLSVAVLLAAVTVASADISLTNYSIYTQDFDTLATSGTSSLTPTDWSFVEGGISGNTTYAAGDGGLTTANTYSLGTGTATDRAFGELTATSVVSTIGAEFQNTGSATMTKILSLSYRGEQWRLSLTGRNDGMDFQISTDATSLTSGTWTNVNALDFTAPLSTGTLGAKDGNASGNFVNISTGKFSLPNPVASGGTFWIRWVPRDVTGTDDAIGIDDFSIQAIPEPSSFALCGLVVGALGISLVRRRKKVAR
jgi:hypothetical protein